MINHNLAGKALINCLNTSGANILFVDEDEGLRRKIKDSRDSIEGALGMKIVICEETVLSEIRSLSTDRLNDAYREGVKGDWPMAMFYTSGTTGMPKGVAFTTARHFTNGAAVSHLPPINRIYELTFKSIERDTLFTGQKIAGTTACHCIMAQVV